MVHAVGSLLHMPNHSAPTPKRKQSRREESFYFSWLNPERIERMLDGIQRRDARVLLTSHFRGEPLHPPGRDTGIVSMHRAESLEEPLIAIRQRPVRDALIQKSSAETPVGASAPLE